MTAVLLGVYLASAVLLGFLGGAVFGRWAERRVPPLVQFRRMLSESPGPARRVVGAHLRTLVDQAERDLAAREVGGGESRG